MLFKHLQKSSQTEKEIPFSMQKAWRRFFCQTMGKKTTMSPRLLSGTDYAQRLVRALRQGIVSNQCSLLQLFLHVHTLPWLLRSPTQSKSHLPTAGLHTRAPFLSTTFKFTSSRKFKSNSKHRVDSCLHCRVWPMQSRTWYTKPLSTGGDWRNSIDSTLSLV